MKPIVLRADTEGRIVITADEIEKIVSDAYDEGYKDGRASSITIPAPSFPDIITTPYIGTKPWEVTCNGGDYGGDAAKGSTIVATTVCGCTGRTEIPSDCDGNCSGCGYDGHSCWDADAAQ